MAVRICVIGGGINGAGVAWELVRKGYEVTLFEKGRFGGATSSATTKMIHGGLRYLETGNISLVHESLRERAFLLGAVPDLVHPLPIAIPIYDDSPRAPFTVRMGLALYDLLAGGRRIARSTRVSRDELIAISGLRPEGLRGGFLYHDAQVDDGALVRRVIECGVRDGLNALEHTSVDELQRRDGGWRVVSSPGSGAGGKFDLIVNAVGPWMNEHLDRFSLPSDWRLTLIRGSHLIVDRAAPARGTLIQARDGRVLFVLPWKGRVLVGTTEAPHETSLEDVRPSAAEIAYLIEGYNSCFSQPLSDRDVATTFAGVRPLIESKADPSRISRESRVETREAMVNVFGGKLTTFMSLARKVGRSVDRVTGLDAPATPPIF